MTSHVPQRRLRVLLCVGTAEVGGTELQLLRLARELPEVGIDAELAFLNRGGPLIEKAKGLGITVHTFEIRRRATAPLEFIRFRRLVHRNGYDLIHAFLPHAIVLARWALVGATGRPGLVAGLRGEISHYEGRLSKLLREALRKSDTITVNAQMLIREVRELPKLGTKSVTWIPNGVEIPAKESTPDINPPKGVVISNFHLYKGYDVLLDALLLTQEDFTLSLFGIGSERLRIQQRAIQLGLEHRLTFKEALGGIDLSPFQFAVHPSLTEGLPNAVLEEMAAGLPIVASRVGGIPSLIGHNGGILCTPGSSDELAEAIDRMVDDQRLRIACGSRNRTESTRYSWSVTASKYFELYVSLIL